MSAFESNIGPEPYKVRVALQADQWLVQIFAAFIASDPTFMTLSESDRQTRIQMAWACAAEALAARPAGVCSDTCNTGLQTAGATCAVCGDTVQS